MNRGLHLPRAPRGQAAPDTLAAALNRRAISCPELVRRSRALARGLMTLGVQRGDRVAILGTTAPDWTISDLAALWAGAVSVPIHPASSAQECEYILRDSKARVALCEDAAQRLKVESIRHRLPTLAHVVVLSGPAPGALSTEILLRSSGGILEADLDLRLEAIEPGDACTVVYTSGTTGAPKGRVLTQADLLAKLHNHESRNRGTTTTGDSAERTSALETLPRRAERNGP